MSWLLEGVTAAAIVVEIRTELASLDAALTSLTSESEGSGGGSVGL